MTKRLRRVLGGLLTAALCAGCVSLPKPLYFTLDMTTPPGEGAGYTALEGRRIDVDTIRVTDKLVRRDILIRLGATELEYYHDALWVSRLADIAAEKFEAEFAPPAGADPAPGFTLFGTLLACEQVDGDDGAVYAHLKLDAHLRRDGASRFEPEFEKMYEFLEPVDAAGPFPAVVVDKLSEGMERIAAAIAADANALPLDEPAP